MLHTHIQSSVQSLENETSKNIVGIASRLRAAGVTSRMVGEQKKTDALTWIYRWGWSSPTLADEISSPSRRGMTKKLVEQGYLTCFPNPAGGDKGAPHKVVCLTEKGQSFVEEHLAAEDLLDQKFSGEIPWHQLRHDYLIQKATVERIASKKIEAFLTPKELAQKSVRSLKQPDAIWLLNDGLKVGVELELTHKKAGREINQNFYSMLSALSSRAEQKLDFILLLSHSQGILDDYKRRLGAGQSIAIYERDASRHWQVQSHIKVPENLAEKFIFRKIIL